MFITPSKVLYNQYHKKISDQDKQIIDMSFTDLGLKPEIIRALDECGYQTPTPIQEKAIPAILMMRDVVGLAQTGTGKTAGFTLPMIEILSGGRAKARMPRSLILSPTRELAAQIAESFDKYGKYCKLSKALLVGGVSMDEQIRILERGADVLIATPGRLLDLFERGNILLTDIKIFVIDEADKMMDMGFIPDITKIASLLPPLKQTLLFSATMPPEIRKLSDKFLSNPKEIKVNPPAETAKTIMQFMVRTDMKQKRETLMQILKQENVGNAFIFCNRKRDIDGLAQWLKGKGYAVAALHGDMNQAQRTETLERFKKNEITLLVCSDVAARGIDVQGLSHVFNFDVPTHADDYVHRIGRTGRAGKEGRAWMLVTPAEEKYVDAIHKLTKKEIDLVAMKSGGASKTSEKPRDSEKTSSGGGSGRGQAAAASASDKPAMRGEKSSSRGEKQEGRRERSRDDAQPQRPKGGDSHKGDDTRSRRKQDSDDDGVLGFGNELPAFFGR